MQLRFFISMLTESVAREQNRSGAFQALSYLCERPLRFSYVEIKWGSKKRSVFS